MTQRYFITVEQDDGEMSRVEFTHRELYGLQKMINDEASRCNLPVAQDAYSELIGKFEKLGL